MEHCPALRELKKALGKEYRIRIIDRGKCLYRDFGNGFSAEVRGCGGADRDGPVTLRLRYGNGPGSFIVRTAQDTDRSAEAVAMAAEDLFDYSGSLLSHGCDTAEKIRNLKGNI